MLFVSPLTLVIAAVLAGPALWSAFVDHELPPGDAATRFLIAVVVAAAMLWALRTLVDGYGNARHRRRAVDQDAED